MKSKKEPNRAGKRRRSGSEGGARLGAGGQRWGRVLLVFSALQPETGILSSGLAEGSFSELPSGLARWNCRPKLGVGDAKVVPG